jgi:hypothetical protein
MVMVVMPDVVDETTTEALGDDGFIFVHGTNEGCGQERDTKCKAFQHAQWHQGLLSKENSMSANTPRLVFSALPKPFCLG